MSELVDDFLCRTFKEKLTIRRRPVKSRIEAAKRDKCYSARTLCLAEDEVEVARAGVEVGGEQC